VFSVIGEGVWRKAAVVLVLREFLNAVDHDHRHWELAQVKPETGLFIEGLEDIGTAADVRDLFSDPGQFEVPGAGAAVELSPKISFGPIYRPLPATAACTVCDQDPLSAACRPTRRSKRRITPILSTVIAGELSPASRCAAAPKASSPARLWAPKEIRPLP
jgi:hypothetical protein